MHVIGVFVRICSCKLPARPARRGKCGGIPMRRHAEGKQIGSMPMSCAAVASQVWPLDLLSSTAVFNAVFMAHCKSSCRNRPARPIRPPVIKPPLSSWSKFGTSGGRPMAMSDIQTGAKGGSQFEFPAQATLPTTSTTLILIFA